MAADDVATRLARLEERVKGVQINQDKQDRDLRDRIDETARNLSEKMDRLFDDAADERRQLKDEVAKFGATLSKMNEDWIRAKFGVSMLKFGSSIGGGGLGSAVVWAVVKWNEWFPGGKP